MTAQHGRQYIQNLPLQLGQLLLKDHYYQVDIHQTQNQIYTKDKTTHKLRTPHHTHSLKSTSAEKIHKSAYFHPKLSASVHFGEPNFSKHFFNCNHLECRQFQQAGRQRTETISGGQTNKWRRQTREEEKGQLGNFFS